MTEQNEPTTLAEQLQDAIDECEDGDTLILDEAGGDVSREQTFDDALETVAFRIKKGRNELDTLDQLIETGELPLPRKRLAWAAWREGWNRKSSTDELTPIEEETARTAFEQWWQNNHE